MHRPRRTTRAHVAPTVPSARGCVSAMVLAFSAVDRVVVLGPAI